MTLRQKCSLKYSNIISLGANIVKPRTNLKVEAAKMFKVQPSPYNGRQRASHMSFIIAISSMCSMGDIYNVELCTVQQWFLSTVLN